MENQAQESEDMKIPEYIVLVAEKIEMAYQENNKDEAIRLAYILRDTITDWIQKLEESV